MAEVRWIKRSFVLLLVLQFTGEDTHIMSPFLFLFIIPIFSAAADKQLVLSGDDATLFCENLIEGQDECDSTTWLVSTSRNVALVEVVTLGEIRENAHNNSDRLSVSEDCSLLIKKVTAEDAGLYICQQYKSGRKQGQDARIYLSVVTMTERTNSDKVTLSCSVSTYERCTLRVRWLYNHNQAKDNKSSPCNASLECQTDLFTCQPRSNFLKCEVKDGDKVKEFSFSPWPSGDRTGKETIRSTTESTATKSTGVTHDASAQLKDFWWLYVTVAVVFVALIIIVVKVVRWKRTQGNETQMNNKPTVGLTSNPTVTPPAPETSQDTADPEDGVSYASISYTKKTNSKAQVQRKNDDSEGTAVTYVTVRVPSTDPSQLYATIN